MYREWKKIEFPKEYYIGSDPKHCMIPGQQMYCILRTVDNSSYLKMNSILKGISLF